MTHKTVWVQRAELRLEAAREALEAIRDGIGDPVEIAEDAIFLLQDRQEPGAGAGYKFLHDHLKYQGDDCVYWPFCTEGRVGRGIVGHLGKRYWAHRLMCEMAHGPAPADKPQACHSCGHGDHGCVNPKHLSWGTNSENQLLRYAQGRGNPNPTGNKGRYTPEQIAEMRDLYASGDYTQMQLTERFGCSLGTIQYYLKYREQRGHEPAVLHTNGQSGDAA